MIRIIGIALVALPYLVVIGVTCWAAGVVATACVVGAAALTVASIAAGVYLLVDQAEKARKAREE
jgi:uncharacterized membrane protein